ncbi:MAG: phosphotransferase [Actinomycetales bacterium]|nr:phosphotransferase [Actinomycetales bacterium]
MGNTPLILAALTKAAVPDANIVHVGPLLGDNLVRIAVVTGSDGRRFEVRMPRTKAAVTDLELELRAVRALDPAARARLPFAITNLVGQASHAKGATALVLDFVPGEEIDVTRLSPSGTLAESLGEALGAIHNLPLSVVVDAQLPEYNPADIALKYVNEMDKMAATGKVPAALLDRWQTALEDVSLFRYQPTVVHGSLDAQSILQGLVDHAQVVTGVLNWSQLHIGDPAEDFGWLMSSASHELSDVVLMAYNTRHPNKDETLRQRAQLYSELAIGRWLLHGVAVRDEEIIADATAMFETLVSELESGELPHLGIVEAPIAPIFEASELIYDAPGLSEDAELDALEVVDLNETDSASGDAATSQDTDDATAPLQIVEELDIVEVVEVVDEIEQTESNEALTEPVEVLEDKGPVDDKTRPIELPAKTDNELF